MVSPLVSVSMPILFPPCPAVPVMLIEPLPLPATVVPLCTNTPWL